MADLEKALQKSKAAQAEVIGQPTRIKAEIDRLEAKKANLDERLRGLGRVGTEEARKLAQKPASELSSIIAQLTALYEEYEDASVAAKEAKARVELYEGVLREKRGEAAKIQREYSVAKAELGANEAINNLDSMMNGSSFDKYHDKVNRTKAKAAGMAEIYGVGDSIRERELIQNAATEDILEQYFSATVGEGHQN